MKNAILIFLCLTFAQFSTAQKKQSLFNGNNLEGWTIYVKDPKIVPSEFFYVKDGVIETPGVPAGYLRTEKEYSDYKLHIEWRWPENPTNSGVFIHVNGPDLLWPAHYQCQLKHLDAGDFVLHGIGEKITVRDTVFTSSVTVKPLIKKNKPSSEKEVGKWNNLDVVAKGNTVTIKVNGKIQNVATNTSLTKGGIGLQAEGSRIQFRNIRIKEIK